MDEAKREDDFAVTGLVVDPRTNGWEGDLVVNSSAE